MAFFISAIIVVDGLLDYCVSFAEERYYENRCLFVLIMLFSFGYNAGLAMWGQSLQDQAMEDWLENDGDAFKLADKAFADPGYLIE